MDCSLLGSSVHGISKAKTVEWAAIPFSRGSSQCRDRTWSPALQADSLSSEPPGKPRKGSTENLWLCAQWKSPRCGRNKGLPAPWLRALQAVMRGPRAGPSTVSVYCLHVFLFAFLMKLSIFIMVLAITGMCYEAALKASDKEKTCALPVLSPSLESVTGDKVGQSDLYGGREIWLGKSNCHHPNRPGGPLSWSPSVPHTGEPDITAPPVSGWLHWPAGGDNARAAQRDQYAWMPWFEVFLLAPRLVFQE